jgi:hypothetical protein
MSENLTIGQPEFEKIESEAGTATKNAFFTLWSAANFEAKQRRLGIGAARNTLEPLVLSDAPSANQNNYELGAASILLLTGSAARNFTGFKAPGTNRSRLLVVHVVGSATYTFQHAHASSEAENRIRTKTLADVAIATDQSAIFVYLNSLWRQLNLV